MLNTGLVLAVELSLWECVTLGKLEREQLRCCWWSRSSSRFKQSFCTSQISSINWNVLSVLVPVLWKWTIILDGLYFSYQWLSWLGLLSSLFLSYQIYDFDLFFTIAHTFAALPRDSCFLLDISHCQALGDLSKVQRKNRQQHLHNFILPLFILWPSDGTNLFHGAIPGFLSETNHQDCSRSETFCITFPDMWGCVRWSCTK